MPSMVSAFEFIYIACKFQYLQFVLQAGGLENIVQIFFICNRYKAVEHSSSNQKFDDKSVSLHKGVLYLAAPNCKALLEL